MRHSFLARTVAERYDCRAPYSDELYARLLELLGQAPRIVLDAGCGTGRLARWLAPHVDRVDAVDPSREMLRVGRALPGGDHPSLSWLEGAVESVPLQGSYGLVTAGASVHWFDLPVALARFAELLDPAGLLIVLDGDGAVDPPWQAEEYALMLDVGEHRTGQRPDFEPIDLDRSLILEHEQFERLGRHVTAAAPFSQTVDDYVCAQQSRATLSSETLGPELARDHESRLRALLAPHSRDGRLHFERRTRIEWGRPRGALSSC